MTNAQSHASFTNWRWKKWRKTRRAILLFVLSTKRDFYQSVVSEMEIKKESPFLSCIELTVQQGNPSHTEYSLRIIYNLQFKESNFWFDIYSFISLLLFNKNNTWRPIIIIIIKQNFIHRFKKNRLFTDSRVWNIKIYTLCTFFLCTKENCRKMTI